MPSARVEKHRYGLVGKNISYSFSKDYFSKKFHELGLEYHSYENFDIQSIDEFKARICKIPNLKGLNVTIPYKETIMDFLDELDEEAARIGAVNTVKISQNGVLKGFNTDCYGFENSLKLLLKPHHTHALILGTGGASKAINYVLEKRTIETLFVSRNPLGEKQISYNSLSKSILNQHTIIVNCTPLGTYPKIEKYPDIPYKFITSKHILYDLIYNPAETVFLKKGSKRGAAVSNGFMMLQLQAEKAWEIWNQ